MYVFSVILDGFYAAAAKGNGGALAVHRDGRILDASPLAIERGVVVGMPLAEARSVLAVDGRIVQWEEEPFRESARRWLETVARYSDAVEPLRQHEALADLTGHPRPREAADSLERELRKAGYSPRCGLAPCRWVARLAARMGDPLGLAHADPRAYVADVPVSSLPIERRVAERLALLGYRTARDVTRIGGNALLAQFGEDAHAIARAILGRGDAAVRSLFPESSIATRVVYETPPETRQEAEAGLDRIARQVGAALRERDAAGRTVELFLELADGSVERRARIFARPLTSEEDVANALRLMLADGPPEGTEGVRARLPGVHAARRTQLDLDGGRSRADRDKGVRIALEHVRGVYGDGAVRLVSEIPVPRWVRIREAYRKANGWTW